MQKKQDGMSLKESSHSPGEAMDSFEKRFERIQSAVGSKNNSELARRLGIQQPSVAGARKRKQIPPAWIVKISEEDGYSANWLLFGEGKPFRKDEEAQQLALIESDQQEIAQMARKLLSIHLILIELIDKKSTGMPLTDAEKEKLKGMIEKDTWNELKNVIWETVKLLMNLIPKMREK